jgi:hypothetical protein
MANRNIRGLRTRRVYDAGAYRIAGTTKNEAGAVDTPVRRRVRLHEQLTGRPVADTWSDATTGAYEFSALALGTYYVTAFDHTGQFAGVIETDVVPEPMP